MKCRKDAWDYVSHMKEEWTEQDWADFYHAVDRALKKIAKRHRSNEQLLTVTKA